MKGDTDPVGVARDDSLQFRDECVKAMLPAALAIFMNPVLGRETWDTYDEMAQTLYWIGDAMVRRRQSTWPEVQMERKG